ncbi:MAG: hypothetical protein QGH60_10455 [Phycisphaerae bacterium]|jgi:hypothetical protein|nr:hypothetical protein [Phycisphaerae bacterium]
MTNSEILDNLECLGGHLPASNPVEILLIGGAAGMLTGEFTAARTTTDCDVINAVPKESQQAILVAAAQTATQRELPETWLNFQAMQLDVLPDGWNARKVHIATFGPLSVCALSRRDLLATKFYAGHVRDREDIQAMTPTGEELAFVRTYLNMLRVPSRCADLDNVQRALLYLDAWEDPRK